MTIQRARQVVDFIFGNHMPGEKLCISFSGGEPLLEFELIKKITGMIEDHPRYEPQKVGISVTTNGTVFSSEIEDFLVGHDIDLCVSCDGPPHVHDLLRSFPSQKGSSALVERTLTRATGSLFGISVRAVYHPKTFRHLPKVIEYFSSLGIRKIHLNSDLSAPWTIKDSDHLLQIYARIADSYVEHALRKEPLFISVIDVKMAAFDKGGFRPEEMCSIGKTGLAFTPAGNIYPCERLIGGDTGQDHCIGNILEGMRLERIAGKAAPKFSTDSNCIFCDIRDYCMNWCSCSNYFSSGYYNRVGPFLCASEKAAIRTAFDVRRTLSERSTGMRKSGPHAERQTESPADARSPD